MHRGRGAMLGDYTGLPLNDAGWLKATSWDASILSLPEEQAKPHPAQYHMRGPSTNLRIQKAIDPDTQALTAYTIRGLFGRADRTIWMDGRSHPPEYALHRWQGFSTGRVVGNQLVVTTTHMKKGWVQRNGAPSSDKATMKEYFVRHGNMLMMTSILEDPVYFDEPLVRSQAWVLTPNLGIDARMSFEIIDEIPERPKEYVPAYPLGTRHTDAALEFGLPFDATRGGGRTLYPEYLVELRQLISRMSAASGADSSNESVEGPLELDGPLESVAARTEDTGVVETLRVRDNLYMLVGDGMNVTVQTGDDGVLVVDAGASTGGSNILAAVESLSDRPIRFLINTSSDPGVTGGNAAIVAAGGPRIEPAAGAATAGTVAGGVALIAHENTSNRLVAIEPFLPDEALPSSTFFTERKDLYFNGEGIELLAQPDAHTDGDLIVYFRASDVVSAGPVLDMTQYPVIDRDRGGTSLGVVRALNGIIEITIPARNQMGGTMVIPGRGRLSNEADVVEYRNMVAIVRDRIIAMVERGLTLEQVKASQPTLDYDGLYGASTGGWTTDDFVEAIFAEASDAVAGGAR